MEARSIIAVILLVFGAIPVLAVEPPVWELQPYRVQLFVEIAGLPEFDAGATRMLADRLAERMEAHRGGSWIVKVSPREGVLQQAVFSEYFNNHADSTAWGVSLRSRPHHLNYTAAKAPPCDFAELDKILLLTVSSAPEGYQIAAREYDVATELWSTAVVLPLRRFSRISDAALDAIFQASAALARVSSVHGNHVTLRLRAAALNPTSGDLALAKPGSIFRLIARPRVEDPHNCVRIAMPATFCVVEEVTREELRCRLETGLHDPLPNRWDAACEVLALGVVPSKQPTTLALASKDTPSRPLVGYDIYQASSDKKPPVFLGRTDQQGLFCVVSAREPLQILLIRHGDQWLARLPLAAGLMPRFELSLQDDPQRIVLDTIRSQVYSAAVENAAQREMLMVRLKKRVEQRQFNAADQLLRELRQLPSDRECIKTAAAAFREETTNNPALQAKIDAILTEAQTAMSSQSDAKALDDMAEQIRKETEPPKSP